MARRGASRLSLDTAFPTDEATIHRSIRQWLGVVLPEAMVIHIPNEGKRSESEGARQKALGLTPGMPDLMILMPGERTIFLEVKNQSGRLRPEQKAVCAELERMRYPVAVVRSIEEARAALRGFGVETREAA